MSTKNDNNSMVILGASVIACLGIFGLYSTMNDESYENDHDYDDEDDEYEEENSCGYDNELRRWEMERWESRNEPVSESYCNSGHSSQMPPSSTTSVIATPESYSQPPYPVSNEPYNPPPFQKPVENFEPSPLGFSTMAGGSKENYNFENNSGLSDYYNFQDYDAGSQNIPVYNELDGQVGLPVPDMSDISAGENNKYVYDRTIGTIGFTSTKIGGRRRGQADYIRGDLPIIPDKNTSFQVSADPLNSLLEGAMNASNGIGEYGKNVEEDSEMDIQMAINPNKDPNKPVGLEALREMSYNERVKNVEETLKKASTNGGQNAPAPKSVLERRAKNKIEDAYRRTQYDSFKPPAPYQGGLVDGVTVAKLKQAQIQSAIKDNLNFRPSQTFGYSTK